MNEAMNHHRQHRRPSATHGSARAATVGAVLTIGAHAALVIALSMVSFAQRERVGGRAYTPSTTRSPSDALPPLDVSIPLARMLPAHAPSALAEQPVRALANDDASRSSSDRAVAPVPPDLGTIEPALPWPVFDRAKPAQDEAHAAVATAVRLALATALRAARTPPGPTPSSHPAATPPSAPAPTPVAAPAATDAGARDRGVVRPAIALELPRPEYPARSARLGHAGTVIVAVALDATGAIESVRVVESSGHATLDRAALDAAGAGRFAPARRGSAPIASVLRLTFRFGPR